MGDSSKRGHSPDMSGVKEKGAKTFKNASEYTTGCGKSYKWAKDGLPPSKARTHSYDPKDTPYEGGNG